MKAKNNMSQLPRTTPDQPSPGDVIDEVNESQLMEAYRNGDTRAFDAIYERYHARVYTYLFRRIKTRETVDELFQAVFMKLHQARGYFDSNQKLAPWVFTICKNTLIDHYRSDGQAILLGLRPSSSTPLAREYSSHENAETVLSESIESKTGYLNLTQHLDSADSALIEMRFKNDLEYDEIASKLNLSESTVRKRLSRALKFMRSKLLAHNKEKAI